MTHTFTFVLKKTDSNQFQTKIIKIKKSKTIKHSVRLKHLIQIVMDKTYYVYILKLLDFHTPWK